MSTIDLERARAEGFTAGLASPNGIACPYDGRTKAGRAWWDGFMEGDAKRCGERQWIDSEGHTRDREGAPLMSAHTPGPWKVEDPMGPETLSSVVGEELADVASRAIMRLADFPRYFRNHGDRVLAEILEEVLEAHRAALRKAGRLP